MDNNQKRLSAEIELRQMEPMKSIVLALAKKPCL